VSNRLLELSREEARRRGAAGAVCVVPVGSLEQHGEHLPIGTDSLLAEHVSLQAAARARADVVVAPTVWTGLSPHHVRLGPTVTLEPELLLELTRSIVQGLRGWFEQVVLVNGHGGNRGWLEALGLAEGCLAVTYWELVDPALLRELFPVDLGSIGHAGQTETSAMLALEPSLVGTTDGAGFEPILEENEAFRLPDMGTSGVLGDPSAASVDSGRDFLMQAVAALAELLDAFDARNRPETKETRP
jgi:creatinine amidohydrolase